jgi:hypothetical protein
LRTPRAAWSALRPAPVVILHNVKQPAAWRLPRSTSRSRGAFLRPGCRVVLLCLHRISPLHVPALRRGSRPNPWRQLQLRPRNEGAGGAPGGVPPEFVAPVRRDLTLARRATGTSASRRSTVALPGPRCVSGISAGAGARLARRPSFMASYGPRVRPRLRAAADATPRSAVRIVSGDAPHERG